MSPLKLVSNSPISPSSHTAAERRRDKRFSLARPGKLYSRMAGRFVPACSRNVSLGGAMLEIETERPLTVGEIVEVGIDLANTRGVVRGDSLVDGIVVRADRLDGHRQTVAVRYLGREAMAAAA